MPRIMVVDDEKDITTLMTVLLESEGHEVIQALNGAEALKVLGLEPARADAPLPDLVIADLNMPVLDGAALCRRLSQNPRTSAIPVVLLTGQAALKDFPKDARIKGILPKPFEGPALRQIVNAALNGR